MGLTQFLGGLANLEFVWIKSLGDLVITCMYSSLAVLNAYLLFHANHVSQATSLRGSVRYLGRVDTARLFNLNQKLLTTIRKLKFFIYWLIVSVMLWDNTFILC